MVAKSVKAVTRGSVARGKRSPVKGASLKNGKGKATTVSKTKKIVQKAPVKEDKNAETVKRKRGRPKAENAVKVSPKAKKSPKKDEAAKIVKKDSEDGEEKPFAAKCFFCPKTFKTLTGLKNHESKCKNKPKNLSLSASSMVDPEGSEVTLDVTENQIIVTKGGEEESKSDVDKASTDENTAQVKSNNVSYSGLCPCCCEDAATAHLTGKFQCAVCSKLFQSKITLKLHIKIVHMNNHTCPQCGAVCQDKGTLARHMYTHTGLKPYSCAVCKQEFSRKYHLARHNMQTGCDGRAKPVFPCQVCGREFNRKDNLREHLRAHIGQTKRKKMFSCEVCGQEFCGSNLLHAHKKIHQGEKQYMCDFCPKKFLTSGAMKKHRRTHTGEKPYQCVTCLKCFAAKETLNRHVRIHTGYKPHACEYCGKRFIQMSQLRHHLYYHTGQSVLTPTETFVCELCGKKFNRRARLNEHLKFVHLGAKPYECDQCTKTFIRKEDLNRHMIVHSGVKAHKCPICSKAFAMKSSLKVHLLTHTKEPPTSCDECGRAFIRQDCLLRHMRSKHRDMLEEIRTEAEKKKLQQQLLQVAAEASLVDGMEDRSELDDKGLTEAVRELLTLLVDEATLRGLGWPEAGVETLLEAVIRRCGHEPAPSSTPHPDRLRHNIKLLFTVVIDDSAVKALLNNQTVDEVILHVLRLAKSY